MTLSSAELWRRWVPIVLAQIVGLICGILGIRLVSHWVSPADYGVYGVFMAIAPVGMNVVFAGLIKFVSRHWQGSDQRPKLAREIARAAIRKSPWLAAICIGATLLAAPSQRFTYGILLFASAVLLAWMQLAQSALQAAREHWRDLGVAAAAAATRSFAPPLLYVATAAGVSALLGGFAAYAFIGAAIGALALRRWLAHPPAPASTAPALTPVYDGPRFVILAAVGWTLLGLNRWVVAARFGSETAGFFTLASNIGTILPTVIGSVLLQYHQPVWFAAPDDQPESRRHLLRAIDRVAFTFVGLAIASVAVLHTAMPLLVGLLVGERYLDAIPFIFATGCWATALTSAWFYHAGLIAAHRERDCTTTDLSGAAVLILGTLVSAGISLEALRWWLLFSPLVPLAVNRTVARRALLRAT